MDEQIRLGEQLQKLRKESGLSQGELAKKIKVSRSTVAMWEANHRVPDLLMIQRLADFYHLRVDDLLGRAQKQSVTYDPQTETFVKDFRSAPSEQKRELIRIWQIIRERPND